MLLRTRKCKKSSHWGCACLEANLKPFRLLCVLHALFYEKCKMLVHCFHVRGWDAMLLVIEFWFQYCRVAKNQIQRYCVPWQSLGFLPHASIKWLDPDLLKFTLRLLWSWQSICKSLCFQSHYCKHGVTLAFSCLYCIVYLPLYLRLKILPHYIPRFLSDAWFLHWFTLMNLESQNIYCFSKTFSVVFISPPSLLERFHC